MKRSLWGYRGDDIFAFLKIVVTDQKFVSRTKTAFERGEINFRSMFSDAPMTFESNIPYTLRFMIDHKVRTVTLPCVTAVCLTGLALRSAV